MYCARKSTSLRAAKRWLMDEVETIETLNTMRRMRPIDTVASKKKLHVLGEFFPSVAMDVRRDVLVAANYCEDVAAAMLGDLTKEAVTVTARTQDPMELLFDYQHADEEGASELADEEDWSEVSGVSSCNDAWVLIQDDWEVVDKNGEKVRTFADVLQAAPLTTPAAAMVTSVEVQAVLLSRLSVVEHPVVSSCNKMLKKTETSLALPAYELERGAKSFNLRKRHMAKHHR
ncbi:unnamed protein product [Peronospora belbahrii]|uniref:CUE domain-containing protein n=1 Tax=Peronospora belbahrii TaxID=622444 RepID=A0ABN8CSI1_9STRA|nr:unnamed protein product [Peronospora belbahrii]